MPTNCLTLFFALLYFLLLLILNRKTHKLYIDELIVAKEHFAEIGDDLDFTFVDMIDGIGPIWSYRHPKPPTPPPKAPSPVRETSTVASAGGELGSAPGEGGAGGEGALVVGEDGVAVRAPKKESSPFDLQKHFPPDAAEVPFVKSFEPEVQAPPPPAPSPVPEAAPEPAAEVPAAEEAPAAEAEAAPATEEAAAPAETPAEAPAAEAPPADAPPAE